MLPVLAVAYLGACQKGGQYVASISVARVRWRSIAGLLSNVRDLGQGQRSVGCVYYGFEGPAPVEEPILVLNGMKDANDDPVNNICFRTG